MTTEPNETELTKGVPTVILGGKKWPVPLLSFRQNKMVVPAIVRIGKPDAIRDMTEATVNDLASISYYALTRAHPSLTRNEFEDMPISVSELIPAMNVIAGQTGLLAQGEAQEPMVTAMPSTSTE